MEPEQQGYVLRSAIAKPSLELLTGEMSALCAVNPRPREIRFFRPKGQMDAVFIELLALDSVSPSTDNYERVGITNLDAPASELAGLIRAHLPEGAKQIDVRLILAHDSTYDIYTTQ